MRGNRDALKRSATRLALVATVVATLSLTVIAPASAATRKPDLIVSKIKVELPGPPPYIVLGASGQAPTFIISVTTKNQGNATAGASVTLVSLKQGSLYRHARLHIGHLAPGASQTNTWRVTSLSPLLGFVPVRTDADTDHLVSESNELNNFRNGPRIAVIPRRLDVTQLSADTNIPQAEDSRTSAQPGFYFRFADLNKSSKKFVYKAYGTVKESFTVSNTCSGGGSKTASQSPWAKSSLTIATSLKSYYALVMSSAAPSFKVTVTCPGLTYKTTVHFADVGTINGHGPVAKKPGDTILQGSSNDPGLMTTWVWDLKAAIP